MTKVIAVIGALDTKGEEFMFVKKEIEKRGHSALIINVGILKEPGLEPDVSANEVAGAAGSSLAILKEISDRGLAIETMSKGIAKVTVDLHIADRIQAVISMGGSNHRWRPAGRAQPLRCCLTKRHSPSDRPRLCRYGKFLGPRHRSRKI